MDAGSPDTRLLFFGEAALSEGFRLVGFETYPDATAQELDQVLDELLRERRTALIILDQKMAASGSRLLPRVRAEGGRILVTEVPPIHNPDGLHSAVDDQIVALLGGAGLD